jgi:predicted outer membrane protein
MKKVLLSLLIVAGLAAEANSQGANLLAANGTVNAVVTNVGGVPLDRFKATNEIAALMVAATPVQAANLSSQDKQLIAQLASLSKAQLKMATLANGRNGREDLNLLAAAMQEEQTIVLDKLRELMNAGNANINTNVTTMAPPTGALSIPLVENYFLSDCGVDNHEQFLQALRITAKQASKPELKQLAEAIIPSVQMRLHISRELKARYYPKVLTA